MLLDERFLPQSCGVLLGMALLSSIPTILLVLTYHPKKKRKWLDPKVMSTSYKWAYHRVTVVVGHHLLNRPGDDPKKAETCWTSIDATFHHVFCRDVTSQFFRSSCGPPAGEAVSSQAEAAEVEIAAGQVLFGEDQLKGGWDGWVLQVFLEISQFEVVWFATTPNREQGFLNLGLALFADPRCWLGDTIPFTTWPQIHLVCGAPGHGLRQWRSRWGGHAKRMLLCQISDLGSERFWECALNPSLWSSSSSWWDGAHHTILKPLPKHSQKIRLQPMQD